MQPVTYHDYMALQRRANIHAEDITEHGQRIEALFNDSGLHAEHIGELVHRLDELQIEQAGNDRTFREVIGDIAELAGQSAEAKRVRDLEGEVIVELAHHVNELTRRIEKLEERED